MSVQSFSLTCAGPPLQFSLPKCGTKVVDFVRIFHSSICSEESHELIGNLNNARKAMVHQLNSNTSGHAEKLHSVDNYLLYVLPFFNSLKNQPAVRLDAEMMFEWVGSFSPNKLPQKFPDIIFEVAMTLHTKAVIHHCLGRQLLYSDPTNNAAVAGQNFHAAAGVMDYLATILLPQWTTSAKRPAETNTMFCRAMCDIFTAETQQMAIVKETQKTGGSLSSLMARLCVSVLRITDECMDHLEMIPKELYSFPTEITMFNRTFYAALAYYYSGELSRIKGEEVGLALAFYRESLIRLHDISNGSKDHNEKFARLCVTSPFLREGIQYLVNTIHEAKVPAERDNNMVYFQAVPTYLDLPSLPVGILVMPKKTYIPPVNDHIYIFKYDASRSDIPPGTPWKPVPPVPIPSAPSAPPQSSQSSAPTQSPMQASASNKDTNKESKYSESKSESKSFYDADAAYALELQKKINEGESI